MSDEFNIIIDPTVFVGEGRDSSVLDANGDPYRIKDKKQSIGFKLIKRKGSNNNEDE